MIISEIEVEIATKPTYAKFKKDRYFFAFTLSM